MRRRVLHAARIKPYDIEELCVCRKICRGRREGRVDDGPEIGPAGEDLVDAGFAGTAGIDDQRTDSLRKRAISTVRNVRDSPKTIVKNVSPRTPMIITGRRPNLSALLSV